MAAQAAEPRPALAKRLREHFGATATEFPVIEEKFKWSDRPNLQVAIDAYLAVPSRSFELVGISAGQGRFMTGVQLADLLTPPPSALMGPPPSIGPCNTSMWFFMTLRCSRACSAAST
jgi:hypothetical protein